MEPEKILVVSDLHYRLPQFDWLTTQTGAFDLIILAGDMLQLKSTVDPDTQAAVVEEYFRKICRKVPLIVCSGNHDIIDDGTGERSAEWLTDLDIPNLTVDWQSYRAGTLHILSLDSSVYQTTRRHNYLGQPCPRLRNQNRLEPESR